MTDNNVLDLSHVLDGIDDLRVLIERLDGEAGNVEVPSHKNLMAQKAAVNRDLLLAAHEADLVRVQIMEAYHNFKGSVEGRRRRH